MQVRYYQEAGVWALYEYFQNNTGNPLVAMPTASGKSVVIAEFIRSIFSYFQGQRVLNLTHVKELIGQNYQKLIAAWPLAPAGVYSAGLKRYEVRPITFAGIASVVNKADLFGFVHLVIIDEAHLVSPHEDTMYQNFIADLKKVNPDLKIIGLTATPFRNGQGMLTQPIQTKHGPRPSMFTDICYNLCTVSGINRLISEGFLAPLIPKPTDTPLNVENVRTVKGEFDLNQLQIAVDKMEVTRKAIAETIKFANSEERPRVKWIAFAAGIEHSDHVAAEMREQGINARSVHSKSPQKWRDESVEWFKEKTDEVRCLVNNGCFTTGFDVPELDLIVMLRPTQSPSLWVQMLGRGMRVAPWVGKENCMVLDFARNTERLGPVNDPRIPRPKGMKGGGEVPIKICEACGSYNHSSVRFCTCCGARFPEVVKIVETAATKELLRSDKPEVHVFEVDHVEYTPHVPPRQDKPPSLKATYSCGKYRRFTEFICLEHDGYAGQRAREFWKTSAHTEPPVSVEEARQRLNELRQPTHIRVWTNSARPQVLAHDYSGTGFNSISVMPQKEAVQK